MTWSSPVALILPPDLLATEGGLQTTVTLNSTNTKQAFLFKARATANIISVFIRTGTVTTSQSIKVSIQSVNEASQPSRPSGTILGATANGYGVQASLAAGTLYEVTLSESVAMTIGDQYAVVIEWTSTAGTAQIVVATNVNYTPLGRASNFMNRQTYTSGSWGAPTSLNSGSGFVIGIRTDASNWWMPEVTMPGVSYSVNFGFGSTNNPDEVGNKLYLPAGNVTALWASTDEDGTGSLVLYDSSDSVVASASLKPNQRGISAYACSLHSITGTAIAEGWYRITLKPDSTTTVSRFVATYSTNQQNGRAMGSNCCLTQRTDAGSWTDTAEAQMMIGVEMEPTFGSGSSGGGSLINSQQLVRQGWIG